MVCISEFALSVLELPCRWSSILLRVSFMQSVQITKLPNLGIQTLNTHNSYIFPLVSGAEILGQGKSQLTREGRILHLLGKKGQVSKTNV